MFWSKIWFFLVAVIAAVALTIALVLPRPADRQRAAEERQRIVTACDVVNILLYANARSRIDLAGKFARSELDLGTIVGPATVTQEISAEAYKTARTAAVKLLDSTAGQKPSIIVLLDGRGRVMARVGYSEELYGDTMAGNYLVDDILAGYMRDDLWVIGNELYLVAGAPIINNGYAGAIVVGHKLDNDLAKQFVNQIGVGMSFYAAGQVMAASDTMPVHKDIQKTFASTSGMDTPLADDCRTFQPFSVSVADGQYTALTARLPGEAGAQGGFYAVFVPRPVALGLSGTLGAVTQSDLSFANFPWLMLGGGFVVMVALGMVIMVLENDRPLRRLSANAVQLAKGELERLDEERHRGRFGSIARSVNIHIDKIRREARAGQSELSDLLGPVSGGVSSPGISAPVAGFAPPSKPPPPSAFKFGAQGGVPAAASAPPPVPGRVGGGAPRVPGRAPTPAPVAMRPSTQSEISINEDSGLLGGEAFARQPGSVRGPRVSGDAEEGEEALFRRIFGEFVALKQQCGESTASLTYDKFVLKLRNNQETLMAKHGCHEVRFQVYEKDGKAALRATPIKD